MDENHQSPKLRNLKQFIRSHQFLKKTTKFLLSVSVFSLFVSHSTFHLNFPALPLKLFTHTIDKNFMFLFCNGLLVLVAKYSRLRNPPPVHNLSNDYLKSYEDTPQMQSEMSLLDERMVEETGDQTVEERGGELLVEEVERDLEKQRIKVEEAAAAAAVNNYQTLTVEEEEKDLEDEDVEEVEENDVLDEEGEEKMEEEEEEEEEEFGEGGVALLSTEELNKKFDEFIRKMKEDLRIEARQQLIMV